MATLAIESVRKRFGAVDVLHGIDLNVTDGEMVVIVGASGCGKSTLLRIVAGLERASGGRVVIGGRDVTTLEPSDRDIAMVFQNYALYPHMSVFQNMAYGLTIKGLPKAEIRTRVTQTAELLGIGALLERKPRQLSGGQRQRVAMGRAIVREPALFLFDEPLSNLDAKLRVQMRVEIKRLQRRLGVTSLYVTHDQTEAMTLGDRLVVMHEGRAAQIATPMEIWDRPADTYVAGFIGSPAMNFLEGMLGPDRASVQLRCGTVLTLVDGPRTAEAGRPVTVGIRPEHLACRSASAGALESTVELVEPLGSETLVHARVAGGAIISAKLYGGSPLPGSTLRLAPESLHVHVFDGADGRRLDPASTRRVHDSSPADAAV